MVDDTMERVRKINAEKDQNVQKKANYALARYLDESSHEKSLNVTEMNRSSVDRRKDQANQFEMLQHELELEELEREEQKKLERAI